MDLRIIGGIYKNRKIKMTKKGEIRPTLVRARKMIFDTFLYQAPEKFSFLDVFAGSGAMGIEALSRRASDVVFFDNNKNTIKTILDNLKPLDKIQGLYSCIYTNIFMCPEGKKMNVVFLDPPYDKYYIIPDVLKRLEQQKWIGDGTIVIVEFFCKHPLNLKDNYVLFKDKKISNSIFQFFFFEENLPNVD